ATGVRRTRTPFAEFVAVTSARSQSEIARRSLHAGAVGAQQRDRRPQERSLTVLVTSREAALEIDVEVLLRCEVGPDAGLTIGLPGSRADLGELAAAVGLVAERRPSVLCRGHV